MKSYFALLLERPIKTQLFWKVWRDAQLAVIPCETITASAACPLRSCKAIPGSECRSASGKPTYHESRHNEYLAEMFIERMEIR